MVVGSCKTRKQRSAFQCFAGQSIDRNVSSFFSQVFMACSRYLDTYFKDCEKPATSTMWSYVVHVHPCTPRVTNIAPECSLLQKIDTNLDVLPPEIVIFPTTDARCKSHPNKSRLLQHPSIDPTKSVAPLWWPQHGWQSFLVSGDRRVNEKTNTSNSPTAASKGLPWLAGLHSPLIYAHWIHTFLPQWAWLKGSEHVWTVMISQTSSCTMLF